MNTPDYRRPRLPTDVVHAPAAAAFTPPAAAGRIVGEFIWYIGDTGLEGLTPGPWLSCHGQQELVADYPELADVVGIVWEAAFGAAAAGSFRLPDVRGRVALGAGGAYSAGTIGGEAAHALTVAELAVHNHPPEAGLRFVSDDSLTGLSAQINAPGFGGYELSEHTGYAGSGQAHNNMPPYIALSAYVFTGRGYPPSSAHDAELRTGRPSLRS